MAVLIDTCPYRPHHCSSGPFHCVWAVLCLFGDFLFFFFIELFDKYYSLLERFRRSLWGLTSMIHIHVLKADNCFGLLMGKALF